MRHSGAFVGQAFNNQKKHIGNFVMAAMGAPCLFDKNSDGTAARQCPAGHVLQVGVCKPAFGTIQICDACESHIQVEAPVYSCRHIDCPLPAGYDICGPCNSAALICPQGHALARFTVGKRQDFVCDRCMKPLSHGARSLGCVGCDFDLCYDCSLLPPVVRFVSMLPKHLSSTLLLLMCVLLCPL